MGFIIDIFNSFIDIPYISYVIAALCFNCLVRLTEKIERNLN